MLKQVSSIFVTLCCLLLLSSCNNPSGGNLKEPPTLPPANSMQMDFSNFEQNSKAKPVNKKLASDNFSRAAVTAGVLKFVVEANLLIPRLLLEAAANSDAELNENEQWEWTYTKTAGDSSYSVRLVASRNDEDSVGWEFYVTNAQAGLENQLFFSGTTSNTGEEGSWSYYNPKNTDSEEQVSHLEWAVVGEDSVELHLEVTSDRNGHKGDYIDYTFNGTVKKAVYYDARKEATTIIEYNINTNTGFIIAPGYNNGEKACWDENFQDTACS